MSISLINGARSDSISAVDRGLFYGDGLFETIRILNQKPVLLEEHLQRLEAGMTRLNILPDFDKNILSQEMENLIEQAGYKDAIVKVIVTRGLSEKGYNPTQSGRPTRIVQIALSPDFAKDNYLTGIWVKVLSTRLGLNPDIAGVKHLNRLEQVLAASELGEQYTEGVMLDTNGRVAEGTRSNIFFIEDKKLLTPELVSSGIHGVMRAWLANRCSSIGLTSEFVDDCTLAQLLTAEEIFFCNSVYGVWPVRELVAGRDIKQFGSWPLTRRIQSLIQRELGMPQG